MRCRRELRDAALRNKIPVLGPNVEGFVNYVDQVAPYGTTPPATPTKGGISVISQSGTVAWTMNQMASDRAVGLRIILGVGNEAVLGLGDLFAWAAADAKTTVVTSYIETMRDVEGIGAGLDALLAARKPVADLRAGGEVRGGAALDHRAHRRAGRQHGPARRVAAGARGRARRGPGHDVRGGRAAVPHEDAAHRWCGRGAAVRRGVHAVRRGRGGRRPSLAGVHAGDEDRAEARPAVVRIAEQPAGRDRPGRRRDRHVRRRVVRAGERPGRRARCVRRVPAAAAGRDPVGGSGAVQGDRAAAFDGGRVRVAVHEPACVHGGGQGLHEAMEAAALPAGASGVGQRDPRAARVPGRATAGGARLAAAREPREGVACAAGGVGAGGRGDRRSAARALRRAPPEGGRCRDTGAGGRSRGEDPRTGGRQGASPPRSRTRRDSAACDWACAAPARSRRLPPTCSRRRGAAAPARPRSWSRRWCTATRCWSERSWTSSSARRSRSAPVARWPKPARRRSSRHP